MARKILFLLALLALHGPADAQEQRVVTDATGRRVTIPARRIERIMPAGPPAAVLLYTIYPETMAGWIGRPSAADLPFLAPDAAAIGTVPRLTARDRLDLEGVRAARPDLILDYGTIAPSYAALADRVQAATGVPYLVLDGSLRAIPETYRLLGNVLGDRVPHGGSRAEELAADAERTLAAIATAATRRAGDHRPRIYYGRGDGLVAVRPGTISAEAIEAVGAVNVVDITGGPPFPRVDIERVASWDPDIVIFALHETFTAAIANPAWQRVRAVRERRVYAAPELPFGFVEEPPSVNRLIGLRWLGSLLYPDVFGPDQRPAIRAFYTLFYRRTPSDADLVTLMRDALPM